MKKYRLGKSELTLKQIIDKRKSLVDYKTLWDRIENRRMSVAEACSLDRYNSNNCFDDYKVIAYYLMDRWSLDELSDILALSESQIIYILKQYNFYSKKDI